MNRSGLALSLIVLLPLLLLLPCFVLAETQVGASASANSVGSAGSTTEFKSLNAKQSADYATLLVDYALYQTPAPKAGDSIQIVIRPALYDESQSIFDNLTARGGEYSNAEDWKMKMAVTLDKAKVFYGAQAKPSKVSLKASNDSGVLYSRGGDYYAKTKKEFLAWDFVTTPGKAQKMLVPAVYVVAGVVNGQQQKDTRKLDLNAIKLGIRKNAATGATETQYVTPANLTQILVSSSKETRVGNYRFKVFLNNKNKLVMMHAEGSDSLKGEDLNNQRNLGEWKQFTDFGSGDESVWGYLTQPEEFKKNNEFVLTLYFGKLESQPLAGKAGALSDVLKDRGKTCSPSVRPSKADYVDYCVKYWKHATAEQLKYNASVEAIRADCAKSFEFTESVLSAVSKSTKDYNFNGALMPVGNCMPVDSSGQYQLSCIKKYGSSSGFVCAALNQVGLKETCTALRNPLTECVISKKASYANYCGSGVCKERTSNVQPAKTKTTCFMESVPTVGGSGGSINVGFPDITPAKAVLVNKASSSVFLRDSDGNEIVGSGKKLDSLSWSSADYLRFYGLADLFGENSFAAGGSAVFEFRDSGNNVVYEAECKLTSWFKFTGESSAENLLNRYDNNKLIEFFLVLDLNSAKAKEQWASRPDIFDQVNFGGFKSYTKVALRDFTFKITVLPAYELTGRVYENYLSKYRLYVGFMKSNLRSEDIAAIKASAQGIKVEAFDKTTGAKVSEVTVPAAQLEELKKKL